jgi:dTDP-4-amino-4,6-dideoxygalactose transaminase
LNKKGISTLIHYPCCPHKQKAYAEYASCSYPVAEMLQNQVLSIPISPVMTKEEVDYVVAMINDFC